MVSSNDVTTDIPWSQIYLHNYLTLTGIALLFYDHALTFGNEYQRIWLRAGTRASMLFFATRYFALLSNIVIAAANFSHFPSAKASPVAAPCADYALFRQTALIASQCMVALVQSLRTYALYGRSRRVAALVFGVGPALGVLSVVAIIGQKSTVVRAGGCHIASSRETAIRIAVAWESLFLFDLMIFGLTFYKSYQERFRFAHTGRNDLTALIMRDGAVYFAVMACAQCANTLTFYLLAPALRGVLSTLASNVSVTMMARLMLNLHRQAAHGGHESTTGMGRARKSSGVVFRVRLEAGPSTALSAGGTEEVEEHELRSLR